LRKQAELALGRLDDDPQDRKPPFAVVGE